VEAKELSFFGQIAASVTHELKNVLAIINESNGLIADILSLTKEGTFPHREKLQCSVKKIEEQVQRGVEITSTFNRFAHSTEYPCVNMDLNLILTQTVSLAQRFAALRNVELKGVVSERPIMLFVNAFRVQMALTRAIEAFIRCMSGTGSITIIGKADPRFQGLCFTFGGESSTKPTKGTVEELAEWKEFEQLAPALDMCYSWSGQGFEVLFAGADSFEQAPG